MGKGYGAIIIGGGFFGLAIAGYLKKAHGLKDVMVLEKESDFMQRASYNNQARVHGGYHYPRSLLTALRSQVNFDRFVSDYKDAIVSDFDKYYAIPKNFSKVSAKQFKLFIDRINAPIEFAPENIKKLFSEHLIEDVFKVREYAFNSYKLKKILLNELEECGVKLETGVLVKSVSKGKDGIKVLASNGKEYQAKNVFNCTYSLINKINLGSGLPHIKVKHELAEMCLVTLPNELSSLSVTVMCGPFFSFMPFPDKDLHTLSHVRYTPHSEWHDNGSNYRDGHKYLDEKVKKVTHFQQMYKDAIRYIPALKKIKYKDSLWEIKTVLQSSEQDDSRPILFKQNHGLKGYACIMGGKLDNIYDAFREIDTIYA